MPSNRVRVPELEHDAGRTPSLGYEPTGSFGCVRCLEHGFPNPLVRWHYHDEYELHLIVASRGKAFVGDYIGNFEPGHLVLTGPRLPHNWISGDVPQGGIALRDIVLQFPDVPLRHAAQYMPELSEVLPLLERARHGIEFFGMSETARVHYAQIKGCHGIQRLSRFVELLGALVRCSDYRLLSSVQLQSVEDEASLAKLSSIVDYIAENCTSDFSVESVRDRLGMTGSQFSRYFRQATGNTFTDFVNHLRINKACELLMETDQYISSICYAVGFNNVANFNRRFLQIKGIAPKEYRRQVQNRFGSATHRTIIN